MIKIVFWILALANVLVLLINHERNTSSATNGHEPARMNAQLQPDKLRLLATPPATPQPAPKQEAPQAAAAPARQTSCIELAAFGTAEAKQAESQLAALNLADRLSRQAVQETDSYIVYIPSQGDKEGADRRAAELQRLGVKDYFIFQGNSSLRNGISLGVFKTREAANTQVARLEKQGVRDVQITERKSGASKTAFQLRDLDDAERAALARVDAALPSHVQRECTPS